MESMRFVFSEERARAIGTTAQECYAVVDRLFARYGDFKVSEGVYTRDDSQNAFTAFGVAHKLPYTDWFLQVIDKWEVWDEDGIPEDCLQLFYEIEARNA